MYSINMIHDQIEELYLVTSLHNAESCASQQSHDETAQTHSLEEANLFYKLRIGVLSF